MPTSPFRQMKEPHVVSFSPMHPRTGRNIRVHLFTCVLALAIAHLMRREAAQHQVKISVRVLLETLVRGDTSKRRLAISSRRWPRAPDSAS